MNFRLCKAEFAVRWPHLNREDYGDNNSPRSIRSTVDTRGVEWKQLNTLMTRRML